MSSELAFEERVTKAFESALERYGRVGLLIDDKEESASRLARELYCSEMLPSYWLRLESRHCARFALAALEKRGFLADSKQRALLIVDRHVFLSCRPESRVMVTIDGADQPGLPHLGALLASMARSTHSERPDPKFKNVLCWLLTHEASVGLDQYSAEWLPRSDWLMGSIRERMARPNFAVLRQFGPTGEVDARHQRDATAWDSALASLVSALRGEGDAELARERPTRSSTPVVLLTGAGASLGNGSYGDGIPKTDALLHEAARRTLPHGPLGSPIPGPVLVERTVPCVCAAAAPGQTGEKKQPKTLPELLAAVADHNPGDTIEYPNLIDLFEPRRHETPEERNPRIAFYPQFRSILERFDHGFTYHHWLMALLPWSCIITTNFDGFHERAAAAAARRPDTLRTSADTEAQIRTSRSILRRGNPFVIPFEAMQKTQKQERDEVWDRLWEVSRLFKPYGTLASPAPLAMNNRQFKARGDQFEQIFDYLFGDARGGWLVVVGHSMQNESIQSALEKVMKEHKAVRNHLQVLWVVPESLDAIQGKRPEHDPSTHFWPQLVKARMELPRDGLADGTIELSRQPPDPGGPLPARAAEFMYDLALRYAGEL
jgi:hypothetical protein